MTHAETYEVVVYLGWLGVDMALRFDRREEYEKALNFLDKLTGARGPSTNDFYYIAEEGREAFEQFTKSR